MSTSPRPRVTTLLALAVAFVVACSMQGSGDSQVDSAGSHHALPLQVAAPLTKVDDPYALASKVQLAATKPIESAGLRNVFKLSENVISGSEPHGEEAFQKLKSMGVKTIVSVDGQKPDVEIAAKYGLRYVHVPIEYKGVSDEELEQLVKTYRECEGPFYAHCFHGMHRGPAAAAIGRIVLDGISREQAIAEMRQWCGTAPEFPGLFRDVATKPIPSEAATRAYAFDFPSARSFGGYRDAMIAISRRDDAIKKLAARDWQTDPSHPDVDAVHEAATLADTLRIAGTLAEVHDRPDNFHAWLKQAAEQALVLEKDVTAAKRGEPGAVDAAKKSWDTLSKTCATCHATYRNR